MDNFYNAMKGKYSIPYNEGFEKTLDVYHEYLFDFYFSDDVYPSARYRTTDTLKLKEHIELAKRLGVKSDYILNSAFYENKIYTPDALKSLADHINKLNVDILTINNMMILQSSHFRDEIDSNIILKNSVNNKVINKEMVSILNKKFNITDVILDRSLNRDRDSMLDILKYCRDNNITTTILLNEGCMPNCMYKQFCDVGIGSAYLDKETFDRAVDTTGCGKDFYDEPSLVLKSPIITRPMVINYLDYVDVLKISGRNISSEYVNNILDYYILNNRSLSYKNLVSTFAPPEYNTITMYMLEEYGYSDTVSNCKNKCYTESNYCDKILNSILNVK